MIESRAFAEWLERVTPEPPHAIAADEISARVATPKQVRRFALPVAAAASVVAAVLIAVVVTGHGQRDRSTTLLSPTASSATSPPASASLTSHSHTATTSSSGLRLPELPRSEWKAQAIAPVPVDLEPMVGAHGILYGISGRNVYAIDPSGRVLASRSMGTFGSGPALVAGGSVWFVAPSTRSLTVVALAEHTLAPRKRITVSGMQTTDGARLTAAPDGRLLVSGGNFLGWIDPKTGTLQTRLHINGGAITGAVEGGPSGSLYVTQLVHRTTSSILHTIDPRTGAVLTSAATPDDNAAVVAATAGGIYLTYGTGHMFYLSFAPNGRPDAAEALGFGAGGFAAYVDFTGTTAWVSGEELACVNAFNGDVLASAEVRDGGYAAAIEGIAKVDDRFFGTYVANGKNYLVELHPPKACFP